MASLLLLLPLAASPPLPSSPLPWSPGTPHPTPRATGNQSFHLNTFMEGSVFWLSCDPAAREGSFPWFNWPRPSLTWGPAASGFRIQQPPRQDLPSF